MLEQSEQGTAQQVTLRSQPFLAAYTAATPGPCHASITLHLVASIGEDMRTVKLDHTVEVLSQEDCGSRTGADRAAKRRKKEHTSIVQSRSVTFRTQEVVY